MNSTCTSYLKICQDIGTIPIPELLSAREHLSGPAFRLIREGLRMHRGVRLLRGPAATWAVSGPFPHDHVPLHLRAMQ